MNKLFLTLLLITSNAFCADTGLRSGSNAFPQCADLIEECMNQSSSRKTACFFSSAKHPFCQGSILGDLALKRWAMSPNRFGRNSAPSAFLGPKVIDNKCIDNFDSKVFHSLSSKTLDNSTIKSFLKEINSCAKEMGNKLNRP